MPNPNTNFSAVAVYTAAQANRFPRGVMAYNASIVSDPTITAEELQITGSSFTAVANRYYRITYFEPSLAGNTANMVFDMRIRQTNIFGAIQNNSRVLNNVGSIFVPTSGTVQAIVTLSAGTTNFVATLSCSAGTGQAGRGGGIFAFLLVEDIGPT